MTTRPPILLLGVERSGTSLLRAMLANHPAIAAPARGELQFFRNWWHTHGDLADPRNLHRFTHDFFTRSKVRHLEVQPDDVLRRLADRPPTYANYFRAVMDAFAARHAKPRWAEKSTSHIDHLPVILDALPDAHIILIARDPRDTFASARRAPWNRALRLDPAAWARDWSDRYTRALDALHRADHPHTLHLHEQLIANPEPLVRRHLGAIAEPFHPACLTPQHDDWSPNTSFDQPITGLSPRTINRWREHLTPDEADTILRHAAPAAERLGYLDAPAPTP